MVDLNRSRVSNSNGSIVVGSTVTPTGWVGIAARVGVFMVDERVQVLTKLFGVGRQQVSLFDAVDRRRFPIPGDQG